MRIFESGVNLSAWGLAVAVLCSPALAAQEQGSVSVPPEHLIIRDENPAKNFEVAYPVGSGRLGAMPFARFPKESILINEETVWGHKGPTYMEDNRFEHLEKMRELEAVGDFQAVDRYFVRHLSSLGSEQKRVSPYQLVGWLNLEYGGTAGIKKTDRSLDLKTGMAHTLYTLADGSTITQDVLASAPDDVIVVRVTADKPINLRVAMEGATVEGTDLVKHGSGTGEKGTRFVSRVRVADPAEVSAVGDALEVKQAKAVTIYQSVATDFNRGEPAVKLPEGWQNKAVSDLDALEGKSYEQVRRAAIADHQHYFNRMTLDLGATDEAVRRLTTPERLARIKQGKHDDPDLVETYIQFGRYLLIASSRPGGLPANLQGIWNNSLTPPWNSDYHLNINVQMNYWPAETTNLAELHTPFFDLIRSFQPNAKEMARRLGMKGWAMGHATDAWGHARLLAVDPRWAASFLCGQWTTFHILEHYRFNRDPKVLEDNWDILTASVEFADSWLIPGPEGTLMARPAVSPENRFRYTDKTGRKAVASMSAGNSYDQFVVLQVFNDYIEAAEVLGKENDPFVEKIRKLVPRVYRPRIGDDGRLMEWRLPFEEPEPGHRHISHIIGAYPGNQINLDDDPVMRDAVIKTLEGRLSHGGARTGWSRAWTIGMFARLSDGARAYEHLHAILAISTLDNLWDTCPPFQIDGNFGATAAVSEMLLHSHNDEIKLLPALPSQWPDGQVMGLRARGDYTVDIQWQDGRLFEAVLHAGEHSPDKLRIAYQGQSKTVELKTGEAKIIRPENF